MLVHGKEYLCVLGYSACFASEQLHSLSATLTEVTQNLHSNPPSREQLRRENERLLRENQDLRRKVVEREKQIADAEEQIADLEREETLAGRGFGIGDAQPAINLVHRTAPLSPLDDMTHPFLVKD